MSASRVSIPQRFLPSTKFFVPGSLILIFCTTANLQVARDHVQDLQAMLRDRHVGLIVSEMEIETRHDPDLREFLRKLRDTVCRDGRTVMLILVASDSHIVEQRRLAYEEQVDISFDLHSKDEAEGFRAWQLTRAKVRGPYDALVSKTLTIRRERIKPIPFNVNASNGIKEF